MKNVLLALSLTLFVGTVATASYSVTDPVKTEKGKKEKKEKKEKKKKAKKSKKKSCASSCCTKAAA